LLEGPPQSEIQWMATHEMKEITIIGGGPAGLFALFYAGMRGASAQIIDALPQAGGQLSALYPEKFVFDVAGFPKVVAKDLVAQLVAQAQQFGEPLHCGQNVVGLEEEEGHLTLVTETDRVPTRLVTAQIEHGPRGTRKARSARQLVRSGAALQPARLRFQRRQHFTRRTLRR
jgi:thioredoxin reductase (NADPH)